MDRRAWQTTVRVVAKSWIQLSHRTELNWTEIIGRGFPAGSVVENPPAEQERQVQSWVRKILWGRTWQPTPVFLPGEFHGQRYLAGYSSWCLKELDITEQFSLSLTVISLNKLAEKKNWLSLSYLFSSVQFSSVAQSCSTFCDPMNRNTPGLRVLHQHLDFAQIHVHRVTDTI